MEEGDCLESLVEGLRRTGHEHTGLGELGLVSLDTLEEQLRKRVHAPDGELGAQAGDEGGVAGRQHSPARSPGTP